MSSRPTPRLSGGRKAIFYAVLVHVALVAVIAIGFRWQVKPAVPAKAVQATAVNDAETRKEIERRQQQEREREQQDAKKKQDQEQQEAKKKRDQDKAAEEQRRQEQAKIAEQKRKDDDKRKAAETDKLRSEEKRKAEIRQKKDTEERRKSAESGLKEQLVREEQERGEAKAKAEKERHEAKAKAEQEARAQSEMARIEGLIRQKVERNWVRPAGWTKGMECIVRVRLAPTGEVINAAVARTSGNPAFDRSVENAVYKASPLPLSDDKGLFEHFRELELRFRPEGQV